MKLGHRERPPLAALLPADDTTVSALRTIHSPMTGTLRAGPGQKQWCQGCGGVTAWPCITRRILDGEPTTIAAELAPQGSPLRFDTEAAG